MRYLKYILVSSDDNLVDRNVHKLDEEADEPHDKEAHARGSGDLRELLPVRLCTHVNKHLRLLGELPERVDNVLGDRVLARRHFVLVMAKS